MLFYKGNGSKISVSSGEVGKITPAGTTFFNVEYPDYRNLFDGNYTVGGIRDNGEVNTAQTSCFVSGFIGISGGAYLYPGVVSAVTVNPERQVTMTCGCTFVAFYNGSYGFLKRVTQVTAPIVIPADAVYARVSWQPNSMEKVNPADYFVGVTANAAEIPAWEAYYPAGALKSAKIERRYLTNMDAPATEGKRWVLFGDSLTDSYGGHDWQASTSPTGGEGWEKSAERVPWTGYFWASRIARELGLVLDNRAESGSNINIGNNGAYDNVCGVNMLNAFLAELEAGAPAPDYITVAFGSNSIVSQLGTAQDSPEQVDTVCGAVKYFISQLRAKCPNAVVGFVLPPQSDWGESSTVKSVAEGREAILSVLEQPEYAVPRVDMWTESGITSAMLPDGIHVSSKQANNLYYHAMRRFMMGL